MPAPARRTGSPEVPPQPARGHGGVDRITVDALTDPERYPPGRQLALLHRALDRLGFPTGESR